jgi:hypothetical protein
MVAKRRKFPGKILVEALLLLTRLHARLRRSGIVKRASLLLLKLNKGALAVKGSRSKVRSDL